MSLLSAVGWVGGSADLGEALLQVWVSSRMALTRITGVTQLWSLCLSSFGHKMASLGMSFLWQWQRV